MSSFFKHPILINKPITAGQLHYVALSGLLHSGSGVFLKVPAILVKPIVTFKPYPCIFLEFHSEFLTISGLFFPNL